MGLSYSLEKANPQHTEESTEPSQNKKSKAAASYGRLLICLPSPETRTMSRIENTNFQRQGRGSSLTHKNARIKKTEEKKLAQNIHACYQTSNGRCACRAGVAADRQAKKGGTPAKGKAKRPEAKNQERSGMCKSISTHHQTLNGCLPLDGSDCQPILKKIRFLWLKPISFLAIFCFKLKKL